MGHFAVLGPSCNVFCALPLVSACLPSSNPASTSRRVLNCLAQKLAMQAARASSLPRSRFCAGLRVKPDSQVCGTVLVIATFVQCWQWTAVATRLASGEQSQVQNVSAHSRAHDK